MMTETGEHVTTCTRQRTLIKPRGNNGCDSFVRGTQTYVSAEEQHTASRRGGLRARGLVAGSVLAAGLTLLSPTAAGNEPQPGVYGFGLNTSGALGQGDGAALTFLDPILIKELPEGEAPQAVAAGYSFSLVLLENGDVYAFGHNYPGQLGLGDTAGRDTPEKILGLPHPATALAAGERHALVLLENGDVYAFGGNFYGQLGLGHTQNALTPVRIADFPEPVRAIAAGENHSLAVLRNGDVYAFGSNENGQLGLGKEIRGRTIPSRIDGLPGPARTVAAGTSFPIQGTMARGPETYSLVLLENGDVYSFGGHPTTGGPFLGHGDFDPRHTPEKVTGFSGPVRDIAAGSQHSLALLENGDVYAFGNNVAGELGHGDTIRRRRPVRVAALSGVTAIAAGGLHSLVLLDSGHVYAFGRGLNGQLGLGDQDNRLTPVQVGGLKGVAAISAGAAHSLVIVEDKRPPPPVETTYSFGYGFDGQLGHGDTNHRYLPEEIKALPEQVARAATGGSHTLLLLENGDVYAFGANFDGQLGLGDRDNRLVPTPVPLPGPAVDVAAGSTHSLVLLENGDLYSFGANFSGQLGLGDTDERLSPVKIDAFGDPVKMISAGDLHNLVLLENGDVHAFGSDSVSQLGLPFPGESFEPSPVHVHTLPGTTEAVAAGGMHSLFLLENGDLYSAGSNIFGQLGQGHSSGQWSLAAVVDLPQNIRPVTLAAGGTHSLVLLENGSLYTFGNNQNGQLGHGDNDDRIAPEKVVWFDEQNITIKGIAAGAAHSLVLGGGRVYAFGFNLQGELGIADTHNRDVPTRIREFSGAERVVAGGHVSLVLGGEFVPVTPAVYSFGAGVHGRLGHGDSDDRHVPTPILNFPFESTVKSVSGEWAHSLALLDNGDVYAFGAGGSGRLGLGDQTSRSVPVRIETLPGPAKAIAAGRAHSLVLLDNGDIYAFGANGRGQLGLGDNDNRTHPEKIDALSNGKAIAAGNHYSLVLLENGNVYAFGHGFNGRLGLGDTTDRNVPAQVNLPGTAQAIATGWNHSLVILSNGLVYGFGSNEYGQLLNTAATQENTPVQVEGLPGPAMDVAAGVDYSLVLLENGDVYFTGWLRDVVDNGQNAWLHHTPVTIGLPGPGSQVSAGDRHVLLLLENGHVYSFGVNANGRLGLGDTDDRIVPERIEAVAGVTGVSAALGNRTEGWAHSLVLIGEDIETMTDEEAVAADKSWLDLAFYAAGDTSSKVTGDLLLHAAGPGGSDITWHSSKPEIVSETGAITRPVSDPSNVTLSATMTRGDVSDTKIFTLTVLPADDGDEAIQRDGDALELSELLDPDPGSDNPLDRGSSEPFWVPAKGWEVTITWESSRPDVVDFVPIPVESIFDSQTHSIQASTASTELAGYAVRVVPPFPGEGDATVTLTATLSLGEVTETKLFHINVRELASDGLHDIPEGGGTAGIPGVEVDVPPGAFPTGFRINFLKDHQRFRLPMSGTYRLVSEVVRITPDQSGPFQKPVLVTLEFDATRVDRARDRVGLFRLNTANGAWEEVDNVAIDWDEHLASGEVTELSRFAVLALPELPVMTSIRIQEGNYILKWTREGTLQQTDDLINGPWNDIPEAISPYTIPAGDPPKGFFRVVVP